MLPNYLVIDDILDDPDFFIDLSKKIEFYKKTNTVAGAILKPGNSNYIPPGNWEGLRSDPLEKFDSNLHNQLCYSIFTKIQSYNIEVKLEMYLHLSPGFIGPPQDTWWHQDSECVMAGLIYLNKNPPHNSGTQLIFENNPITIDNVFNRLTLYNSNYFHRLESGFGDNIDNTRLTLPIFITELKFLSTTN